MHTVKTCLVNIITKKWHNTSRSASSSLPEFLWHKGIRTPKRTASTFAVSFLISVRSSRSEITWTGKKRGKICMQSAMKKRRSSVWAVKRRTEKSGWFQVQRGKVSKVHVDRKRHRKISMQSARKKRRSSVRAAKRGKMSAYKICKVGEHLYMIQIPTAEVIKLPPTRQCQVQEK